MNFVSAYFCQFKQFPLFFFCFRAVKILDDYLMKSKNTGEFTLEADRTYTIVLAVPEK